MDETQTPTARPAPAARQAGADSQKRRVQPDELRAAKVTDETLFSGA